MVIAFLVAGIAIGILLLGLLARLYLALHARQRIAFILLVAVAAAVVLSLASIALSVAQLAAQPVVSCSPVPNSTFQPPATLVTAQDHFSQGDYEFDRGNCDAAIAAYTRAIQLKPDFAEAYNNRAYTYMVKKDYADALPDLNKAIQIRPNYVNALMNRGDIYNYYYQIDYPRAIADYNRVLALGSSAYQHTSLCGHLAMAHHQGNLPGAFIEFLSPARRANACAVE